LLLLKAEIMTQEKKLRILFVTNNYTPYAGGVVSSINAVAEQLRMQGHKVFIVAPDFFGKSRAKKRDYYSGDINNDPYFVLRVPSLLKFKYKKNRYVIPASPDAFIRKQIGIIKPDIIHVHHPFLLGNTARKIAKELSLPVIFTYHTVYEKYVHYVPAPGFLMRPIVMYKVAKFCSRIDGIVVPSTRIEDFLSDRAVTTPKLLLPSPISPLFLAGGPVPKIGIAKPSTPELSEYPVQLLSVGRFVREKNITFLLDVIKLLPENKYQLTLVGHGAEQEKLQQYAYNTLGLSRDTVRFVAHPTKHVIRKQYAQAHLFLFSSTSDAQGLVLAEAMGSGTPVIALDGPGQRDCVVDGKNGFLVRDRAQMAAAIERVVGDAQLYGELSLGARATADRYAPEVLVGKLVAFYREIQAGKRPLASK
jgi:1,2-diacylglycerol 3-alpha-glucosyltransferase